MYPYMEYIAAVCVREDALMLEGVLALESAMLSMPSTIPMV